MTGPSKSQKEVLLDHRIAFEGLINSNAAGVKSLDGHNLDLATVLVVARYVFKLCSSTRCSAFFRYNGLVDLSEKAHNAITARAPKHSRPG